MYFSRKCGKDSECCKLEKSSCVDKLDEGTWYYKPALFVGSRWKYITIIFVARSETKVYYEYRYARIKPGVAAKKILPSANKVLSQILTYRKSTSSVKKDDKKTTYTKSTLSVKSVNVTSISN